ncbi:craniofacial development protein 2-like [Leucoraja erinacea]|uniref:craniofacial development protein 2-like n=1 Tax=Leucoraja erinaceus TaxID=7782 RepID=UPI0024562C81|nr:craniofacial development protein 2-like [Leucoraja erinacea]
MNENGERLIEFCTTYNLVIGGTIFPHRRIHKLTWYSPNGKDKNQIDHLMINGTGRRSLLDVKVKRGADVGTDHHLVLAVLKVKLWKKGSKKTDRQQSDVEKLHDPKVKGSFVLQLRNRFQALADMDDHTTDINTVWVQTKIAYVKTREACQGFKQKTKRGWMTEDTWQIIENRRKLKKQINETKSKWLQERYKMQYQEANKAVQRKARAEKRGYLEDLTNQAEDAAKKREQGKVYKITKIICGKNRRTIETPIVDKKGRFLTKEA